jgi:hypothetical protein
MRAAVLSALALVPPPGACLLAGRVVRPSPPRAVVNMQWVNAQHSQGMLWVDDDNDASPERSKLAAGPSPSLKPAEVVELLLNGFQRGSNADVEDLFKFVLPSGELAVQHSRGSADPMVNFRIKVRKEPRWKNIAGRPQAALMHMRKYDVMGGVMTDPDVRIYMVRAEPFFPDAPHAESDVVFQLELVRVRASRASGTADGEQTAAANCWMVNRIDPKFEDWAVRDRIHAGRCPDVFKPPKRSAEDA